MRLPPLFTIPMPGALRRAVARGWGLTGAIGCSLWFAGINSIYRVSTPRGRFFLRIPRRGLGSRTDPEVECALVAHLKAGGCAVAAPVATPAGRYAVQLELPEGRVKAVLFDRAEGDEDWRWDIAHAEVAGRTLARIHASAEGFGFTGRLPVHDSRRLVRDSLTRLASVALPRATRGEFGRAGARISRGLARLPRAAPGWGVLHGDAIPTNVRFAGTPPAAVWYDFEFCGVGWRAWDIASFRHFQLYAGWDDGGARRSWAAFLRGYSSVRPIAPWELRSVDLFAAARQLWIAGLHAWFSRHYGDRHFGPEVLAGRLPLIRKLVAFL